MASLALGIGVNTAIFSLVEQLLLWSVPARDPASLVMVDGGYSDSYPFFREYSDRNQVFSATFASSHQLAVGLRPEGAPAVEVGHAHYVSGSYFAGLGIDPAVGRVISRSDDLSPGGSPIAVLSYDYWQRRFAGDAKVVGRKLALNGYPLEIAGVAQKGFGGIFNGEAADVFVPLTMYPVTTPSVARAWNTPNMFWLVTMARLKTGVSMQKAEAAMRVLWPQAADAVNAAIVGGGGKARKFRESQIQLSPGARGTAYSRKAMADPLRTLAIATGLVLLIACANVANLLLSRATKRRREIAVRLALGATRGRLVRALLGESLVLSILGGALGLLFAYWGVSALARSEILSPNLRFEPSPLVLALSTALTLLTAVLFGLAPAFRATGLPLVDCLKDGSASSPGGSRLRMGKALVAAQVAMSVALLVGAGLFIRTLRNLQHVDLGFQRDNVVVVDVDPTSFGYRGQRLRAFYDQLLERARRIPGVRDAGLSDVTPFGNYMKAFSFSAEGYEPKPDERMIALGNAVSDGYFKTMGVPILLGRDFRPEDEPAITPEGTMISTVGRSSASSNELPPAASRVCVIDETLARKLFPGASPIGRHLSYSDRYKAEGALEIVGVVKSVHYAQVKRPDREGMFYSPSWSDGAGVRWLVLRTASNGAPVVASVTREIRRMDPNIPVLHTSTMEGSVNSSVRQERMIAFLGGFFGVLAMGLASVGLYGVMAYAVTQRTREIGIRMALGAKRGEVLRMIVRESMLTVAAGLLIGLAGAFALTRFFAALLYGVAPRDPLSMVAGAAAMLIVALAAAAAPARRASRVDPMQALRYQ